MFPKKVTNVPSTSIITPQDKDKNLLKWFSFPDLLKTGKFSGYQTRYDETQVRGSFVAGQNVMMNESQNPTLRKGFELIGTDQGDSFPVNRAWVFERRDGTQIEIKAYNTGVYCYIWGASSDWSLLKSGFTSALEFGYANTSIVSDIASSTYFCNGTDSWYKWTGAYATYASDNGANTITVQGSTGLISLFFRPAGTIIINGTEITYTGINGQTFKGCSAVPAGAVVGNIILQSPFVCTGTNIWQTWNGIYGTYASDNGANTITVQGSTGLSTLGFGNTGTIFINNQTITYTGLSGQTFTGCSTVPTTPAVGDVIASYPSAFQSSLDSVKSQVMLAHDDRIHARQESKQSVWNYSNLGNPDSFATGSSDGNGGAKEVEMGGPIVAFANLNKKILAIKNRNIKNLQFIQVGSRVDSPEYGTFVSVDDKGTSLGAQNQRSTFSTPYGVVFATPDKRLVLLSGVTANDEPQYFYLSDPIVQVFDQGVHNDACGICVDNRIYYSFKQDSTSTFNDVEIQGNMLRQTFDAQGKAIPVLWDTVNIGVNCKDYTAIYNSSLARNEVHRHSSLNSNSYRIIDNKTDQTNAFTATVRTWAEVFGAPDQEKVVDACELEIKMLTNSVVTATVLYNQDGTSQQTQFTLKGTDTNNLISSQTAYNPFGASAYGSQRIGSNPQQSAMQRYLYYLELDPNVPFFNISLQLDSNTQNSDFELVRFSYRLIQVLPEVEYKFKKSSS